MISIWMCKRYETPTFRENRNSGRFRLFAKSINVACAQSDLQRIEYVMYGLEREEEEVEKDQQEKEIRFFHII